MQSVSAAYLDAIAAPVREIVSRVEIAFLDNTMMRGGVMAEAGELDHELLPLETLIDGVTLVTHKLAFVDPYEDYRARVFPADDLYPMTSEGGWWGDTLADDDGYISGGEMVTLTYSQAQNIRTLRLAADARLGYPVDFAFDYWDGNGWVRAATINDNDNPIYLYQMPLPVSTTRVRVVITRVSHGQSYAKLLEFDGGLIEDVSSRVKRWEVMREREADGSQPVGNASANSLALELDNTDRTYYRKSGSAIAPYLVENRRITVWCGVRLADGRTEMLPQGVFYTRDWTASESGTTARVTAWDRAKRMAEEEFATGEVLFGKTHAELAETLGTAYGLQPYEMQIDAAADDVTPYAWFGPASYWYHLKCLATGQGGAVYFDEGGRLVFESRKYLASRTAPVVTLRDVDAIIEVGEEWQQERKRNVIIVPVKPLAAAARQEIVSLSEAIPVRAGATRRVTLFFSASPCIDVETPEVTGDGHISVQRWTAYAWGGSLTLANSGASDETVTQIVVHGRPLMELGGARAIAEDEEDVVRSGGRRVFSLPDEGARFVQSLETGEKLAGDLLATLINPGNRPTVRARGRPELQLGDRIRLQDERMGYDGEYWITRIRMVYDGGLTMEMTALEAI